MGLAGVEFWYDNYGLCLASQAQAKNSYFNFDTFNINFLKLKKKSWLILFVWIWILSNFTYQKAQLELQGLFTHLEMVIVLYAICCGDGCYLRFYLLWQSNIQFWSAC